VNWEDTLSSLAPGETRKFQIHQAFLKGDSVDLKIAVDPYNTVAESNKDNNLASGKY
jgi:subtilase family serine protease